MKFKEQLKLIEEALLKPMSDVRVKELDAEKIKIQVDEIKRYATLNSDGTYDVDGDVNLTFRNLTELPMKFGKVSGYFDCSHNKLTTLEGAPREVRNWFSCSFNRLTSLKGAPETVRGLYSVFYCQANKVKFTEEDVRAVCNITGNIIYV